MTVRDFPSAVSLGFVSFQIALVAGPVLGGVVLARYGPASPPGARELLRYRFAGRG